MKIAICMMKCLDVGYGSVKSAVTLANEFAKRGYDVSFVCYDKPGGRLEFPLDPRVKFRNLATFEPRNSLRVLRAVVKVLYNVPSFLPVFLYERIAALLYSIRCYILNSFAPFWSWHWLLHNRRYDVVSIHGSDAIAVIPLAVQKKWSKLVITLHSMPKAEIEMFSFGRIPSIMKRIGLGRADTITVLQKEFIEQTYVYCRYHNKKRIVCIPNIIYESTKTRERRLGKHVNFIAVGSLVKEKNFDILIEALSLIDYKEWSCNIWGQDSGEMSNLRELIARLNLDQFVFLRGFSNEIEQEIDKADFIVQPSYFEGFPLAVAEAMTMGVVPIGFASCPGINNLIEDSVNGLLVVGNNALDLSRAIETILRNPNLYKYLSRNAIKSMQKYTPQSVMPKWEQIINE